MPTATKSRLSPPWPAGKDRRGGSRRRFTFPQLVGRRLANYGMRRDSSEFGLPSGGWRASLRSPTVPRSFVWVWRRQQMTLAAIRITVPPADASGVHSQHRADRKRPWRRLAASRCRQMPPLFKSQQRAASRMQVRRPFACRLAAHFVYGYREIRLARDRPGAREWQDPTNP